MEQLMRAQQKDAERLRARLEARCHRLDAAYWRLRDALVRAGMTDLQTADLVSRPQGWVSIIRGHDFKKADS